MKITLNSEQVEQLAPLKAMMDSAPSGTSTLAQVIWRPNGQVFVKVTLINPVPFRKIYAIVDRPNAIYKEQKS